MRALIVVALMIGAVSALEFKLPELNVDAKASVSPCGAVSASASTGLGASTSVKIDTPELKIEKSSEPCADLPSVKKTSVSTSFSAKSSASASASSRSSSSYSFSSTRSPCVRRRRFGPRRCISTNVRVSGPCVRRVVSGPCTTRRPCSRVGCVRAPCVRRRRKIIRRARKAGSGPRQAPTCFRPTADLLRGKDLEVQMLAVRGMEWKCEPIQQEPVPNEPAILPDPSPELPAERIIQRACDKTVE